MQHFWKDKKVFITGATGFIGSWLTKRLVDLGAEVTILVDDMDLPSELIRSGSISHVNVIEGKLQQSSLLEKILVDNTIDTVFHLGAQTQVTRALSHSYETFDTNIRGTYSLLEACRHYKSRIRRIIIASSDKAYGIHQDLPYVEHMPLHPSYPYDVSKACSEMVALSYYHTYALPIVITRCGNVYGGGDFNWERLLPSVIRNLCREERPFLRSDGKSSRDYVFIEDILQAYLLLGETLEEKKLQGEVFNFGGGFPIKTLQVVQTLIELTGKKHLSPIIADEAPCEIQEQYLDSNKAWTQLSWKPQVSFKLGLSLTLEWYLQFFKENTEDDRVDARDRLCGHRC